MTITFTRDEPTSPWVHLFQVSERPPRGLNTRAARLSHTDIKIYLVFKGPLLRMSRCFTRDKPDGSILFPSKLFHCLGPRAGVMFIFCIIFRHTFTNVDANIGVRWSQWWHACVSAFVEVCLSAGDVVWCGVVWCGAMWCGVVWCGVVWCGVV